MCFSAAASFTAAGVLAGVGAVSIAKSPAPRYHMFAAIPLIFAAQQASEGVVWLTIGSPAHATLRQAAVFVFLAFALVFWPLWLSISLRAAEPDPRRRRALTWMGYLGVVVAGAAAINLTRATPIAVISGHSIRYDRPGGGHPQLELLVLLAYAIPTVGPFFASSMKLTRLIGAMLVISIGIAAMVEHDALTSVWCFFAAVLSCSVVAALGLARGNPVEGWKGGKVEG